MRRATGRSTDLWATGLGRLPWPGRRAAVFWRWARVRAMGQSSSRPSAPPASILNAFGGQHKKGLEGHLDALSDVQKRRVLLHVNKFADSCFRECVTDMAFSRYLRSGEHECLNQCVEKYVALSASTGGAFASFLDNERRQPVEKAGL